MIMNSLIESKGKKENAVLLESNNNILSEKDFFVNYINTMELGFNYLDSNNKVVNYNI